ncbi:MAG TPA: hypothetical protein VMD76_10995 [Candidatus Sulfotelmatobacter sp.]|nr:hypothetical protein [Candidatus Sulfotelmatobacter sp.]
MKGSARAFVLPCLLACLCLCPAAQSRSATVAARPDSAKFDGPAELPRVYMKTSLADTPAPGKVRLVKGGEKLQDAIDSANCGDTLELEAGAVFKGPILLPKKHCDDARWIVIRTSAADALPPEGTRLTPCYAGVASLPGRPDFHCASTKNVMAKIEFAGAGGSGPIFFDDGANHYRFIGIEITRDAPGVTLVDLIGPKGQVPADHIIFDRVWAHGTAHDDTRRGLFMSGTTYMAVVDSFFSDFHCAALGNCGDSQTISGAAGDLPMGPFKIVNNFLEASGENILFGGAAATSTPADIEIRHNYLFKPALWMAGAPGFVGGNNGKPFVVKNLFELKNAQRLLFEGNVLENAWGGFSQTGIAILLTAKNPNNLCPRCLVTDITVRYCRVSHVGGGLSVGNVPGEGGSTATAGERYSIHDIVFDDIDGKKYNGFGVFLLLLSNTPALKDVKIDHNTAVTPRVTINMGVKNGKMQNFIFTNNLLGAGEKQLTSSGGGPENCVFKPDRQTFAGVLNNCVSSYTVTKNVIIGGLGGWPDGNFFPKNVGDVGFEKNSDRLCHAKDAGCNGASKFAGAGSDGKDIGADIGMIDTATKGVI